MTEMQKEKVKRMRTIGYWSEYGGIEVKNVEYGIEDYIVCVSNTMCSIPTVHRVRLNYTQGARCYIRINNHRFYLDECLRN